MATPYEYLKRRPQPGASLADRVRKVAQATKDQTVPIVSSAEADRPLIRSRAEQTAVYTPGPMDTPRLTREEQIAFRDAAQYPDKLERQRAIIEQAALRQVESRPQSLGRRSVASDIAMGTVAGVGESVLGTVQGGANLVGLTGLEAPAEAVRSVREGMRERFQPETVAGQAAALASGFGAEAAQFIGSGKLVGSLAGRVAKMAQASKFGKASQAVERGVSALQRSDLAQSAVGTLPVDVAKAASPEDTMLGAAGELLDSDRLRQAAQSFPLALAGEIAPGMAITGVTSANRAIGRQLTEPSGARTFAEGVANVRRRNMIDRRVGFDDRLREAAEANRRQAEQATIVPAQTYRPRGEPTTTDEAMRRTAIPSATGERVQVESRDATARLEEAAQRATTEEPLIAPGSTRGRYAMGGDVGAQLALAGAGGALGGMAGDETATQDERLAQALTTAGIVGVGGTFRNIRRGIKPSEFKKLSPEIQTAINKLDPNTGYAPEHHALARSYRDRIREVGRNPQALAQEADQLASTAQVIREGIASGALDPKRHGLFADTAEMMERGVRVLAREAERTYEGVRDVGAPGPLTVLQAHELQAATRLQQNPQVAEVFARQDPVEMSRVLADNLEPVLLEAAQKAIQEYGSLTKWYNEAVRDAQAVSLLTMPELADPRMFALFNYMGSALSNGNPVAAEVAASAIVFQQFLRTGRLSVFALEEGPRTAPGLGKQRDFAASVTYTSGKGKKAKNVTRPIYAIGDDGDVLSGGPRYNAWQSTLDNIQEIWDLNKGDLDQVLSELMGRGYKPKPLRELRELQAQGLSYLDAAKVIDDTYQGKQWSMKQGERLRATQVAGIKLGQYGTDKNMWLRDELRQAYPAELGEGVTNDMWMARLYNQTFGRTPLKTNKKGEIDLDDGLNETAHTALTLAQRELAQRVGTQLAGAPMSPRDVQALLWEGAKRKYAAAGSGLEKGAFDTIETGMAKYMFGEPRPRKMAEIEGLARTGQSGLRVGAARPDILATAGGTAAGALGGALTGATPEERMGGALGGAALLGGAGALAGRVVRRTQGPLTSRPLIPRNVATLEDRIVRGGGEFAPRERLLSDFDRFRTGLVSETLPIEKVAELAGGEQARAVIRGAIAQSQGAGLAARDFVNTRLGEILAPFKGDLETMKQLDQVAIALRENELRNAYGTQKVVVSDEEIARGLALAEANPQLAQAAEQLTNLHRELLEMRHDAGLLSDEDYLRIISSESFYTPFVNLFEADASKLGVGSKGRRFTLSSKGVAKMDRTKNVTYEKQQIASPVDMTVYAITKTLTDISKQRVANLVFEQADAGNIPFIRTLAPTEASRSGRVVEQIRDGKLRRYEIMDEDLYNALAVQSSQSQDIATEMLRKFKELKQKGITTFTDFALKNVIRDVGTFAIQRRDVGTALAEAAGGAAAGAAVGAAVADEDRALIGALTGAGLGAGVGMYARPMLQVMKAMGEIIGNKQVYREWIQQGGSTEGFYVRTPSDAREVVNRLVKDGVKPTDIINPKNWYEALRYVGGVGEQATRLATYKNALAEGKSIGEAVFESQDVSLRFANRGANQTVKMLSSVTPFWNATIQGWDKLARLLGNKRTWGLGAVGIAAPSLALWSINKDDPEYWERPLYERNLFWLIPKPESMRDENGQRGFFRIPKPFEVGYIFASLPERFADYLAQRGVIESAAPESAEPGRTAGRAVRDMAFSTLEGTIPLPAGLDIAGQLALNKNLFLNRPIERRTDIPKAQRVSDQTSAVARALGQRGPFSPEQIDFALRDVAGTAGRYALEATDVLARKAGLDAPAPRASGGTRFIPSAFETKPQVQSESEAAARDRMTELQMIKNGYTNAQAEGPAAAREYLQENRREIILQRRLAPLEKRLKDIATQRRAVSSDRSLSDDQRNAKLARLREQSETIARRINATQ